MVFFQSFASCERSFLFVLGLGWKEERKSKRDQLRSQPIVIWTITGLSELTFHGLKLKRLRFNQIQNICLSAWCGRDRIGQCVYQSYFLVGRIRAKKWKKFSKKNIMTEDFVTSKDELFCSSDAFSYMRQTVRSFYLDCRRRDSCVIALDILW